MPSPELIKSLGPNFDVMQRLKEASQKLAIERAKQNAPPTVHLKYQISPQIYDNQPTSNPNNNPQTAFNHNNN